MLARKTKPIATDSHPTGVAALKELSTRIEELIRRDGALLQEQLSLEGAGAAPSEETKFDPNAEAKRLLNGAAGFAADVGMAPPQRLAQVIKLRQAISSAIDIGRKREEAMRLQLSAELGAAEIAKWRELLAEAEKLAAAVAQLGEQFRDLDQRYRRATGVDPDYTGELPGGFAMAQLAGEARAFLQRGDVALARACQTMGGRG
jgi:hypothetical protein